MKELNIIRGNESWNVMIKLLEDKREKAKQCWRLACPNFMFMGSFINVIYEIVKYVSFPHFLLSLDSFTSIVLSGSKLES